MATINSIIRNRARAMVNSSVVIYYSQCPWKWCNSLVSQARPLPQKEERVRWTVYTSCVPPHHIQSCYNILSHDTLHHCLSSNNGLENSERELGHLFRYCRSCKNTLTLLLGELRHQLIAFWWDMACIQNQPDSSLFLQKWIWLARPATANVHCGNNYCWLDAK